MSGFTDYFRSLTCAFTLAGELWSVDDAIDGCLSYCVLLLQQLNGFPQLVQLRVLTHKNVFIDNASTKSFFFSPSLILNNCDKSKCKCVDIYFLFCGHGEALQSDGHVTQTLLKRCHQVGLIKKNRGEEVKQGKEGSFKFKMTSFFACMHHSYTITHYSYNTWTLCNLPSRE